MDQLEIQRLIRQGVDDYDGDEDNFVKCGKLSVDNEVELEKVARCHSLDLIWTGNGYLLAKMH